MSTLRTKASYPSLDLKMIVLVVVATTLFYPAFIDSTLLIHSQVFTKDLENQPYLHRPFSRVLRDIKQKNGYGGVYRVNNANRICIHSPCGWMVFEDQSFEDHKFFIANGCKCRDRTYKCVRDNELLASKADAYRCRQNTTKDDIEAPIDDIYMD